MKSIHKIIIAGFIIGLTVQMNACKIDNELNPNNPSLEGTFSNATIAELNNLVTGAESGMRNQLGFYLDDVGVIGREIYRFAGSEPRYTADLLGGGNSVLDNNTFYTTLPWAARYAVVKNTNILINAIGNTNIPSEAQKNAYLGFANTIKAYQLLLALNLTNENGIRIDVANPDKLGPIVPKTEALTAIAGLLETGLTQLNGAGTSFPFQLSSGFSGFNTPDGFKQFNRALAARVAIYRGQFAQALVFLNDSFLNLTGDFNTGVYHVFSTGAGDRLNPIFYPLDATGEVRVAQPNYLSDALAAGEGADDRLQKIAARTEAVTQSSLTGTHDLALFSSNTDKISIIRNEELILIYAEAKIRTGAFGDAVTALNTIRRGHGLGIYAGALTEAALINEMLKQRRYSLYMEGHRWIDMRRYNKLSELPIDRSGDDVWVSFPIPFPENAG